MNWLDKLAKSRHDEQQQAAEKQQQFLKTRTRIAKEIDPWVRAQLKQLGKAYWKSVGRSFAVERSPNDHAWKLRTTDSRHDYDYWSVVLGNDTDRWFLVVYGKDKSVTAAELSPEAFDSALQEIVLAGPCLHREY